MATWSRMLRPPGAAAAPPAPAPAPPPRRPPPRRPPGAASPGAAAAGGVPGAAPAPGAAAAPPGAAPHVLLYTETPTAKAKAAKILIDRFIAVSLHNQSGGRQIGGHR